jgi:hypothetical protein
MAETLDVLKKLGKSVARGVPQLATGFVDLAALPLTMTGVRKPEQIFGSTAYLTDKGLLPQPQTGLLNEGAELASSMLNPAAAAKGATVGLLGTFIGKGSKLWNAESNSIAKALEKEGLAPETIWSQTGNVKAPDGKWRQEISDVGSKITDDVYKGIKENQRYEGLMSNALEHPELYKAYPDVGNIKTGMYAWSKPEGSYMADTRTITAGGPSTGYQKSAALHEIQHDIQQKEGFARGGSPENFPSSQDINDAQVMSTLIKKGSLPSEASKWVRDNLGRSPSTKAMDLATKQGADVFNIPSNTDQYRRLAGEAEARLTQRRMSLSPEQRLQYFPYSYGKEQYGLDVPYNELIIKGLLD